MNGSTRRNDGKLEQLEEQRTTGRTGTGRRKQPVEGKD
jgi:hypothetical protein